jgi:hypothetical protein
MLEQETSAEATRRRRYRLFITAEGVLLLITILACAGMLRAHVNATWATVLFSALCVWHIVTIPICFLYLIGRPVVMTLVPLVDSAESQAFRKELRERAALSDAEFYARYYEGSGIPSDIPARVRRTLYSLDSLFEGAIPTDHLCLLYDELDFLDVVKEIEQEFKLRLTKADWATVGVGTLDNLIRVVHRRSLS